jgi:hypothetical protein
MEEVLTGWQPDPFGVHEKRFFTSGGLPTKLVSDGDIRSYDEPPSSPSLGPSPGAASRPEASQHPAPIRQPEPTYQTRLPTDAPVRATELPPDAPRKHETGQNGRAPGQLTSRSPRLALLCAHCGQRHNAIDGVCPQCGEVASVSRPPAEPFARQDVASPPPTVSAPAVRTEPLASPSAPDRYLPPPPGPATFSPPANYPAPAPAPAPFSDPAPVVASPNSVNPFAIASLVLSLIGLPFVGSILAIVFGVHAKRQIRETPGGQGGKGMASWGIALGCLGLLGAVIAGGVLLLGGSHNPTPGAAAATAKTATAKVSSPAAAVFVRSPEKAAFSSASKSLDAANDTFTRSLASSAGNSVSGIAQAVTPYVTALTTFDYELRHISWSSNVQIQVETLGLKTQDLVKFLATISSVTPATSSAWTTHLRSLATASQSADNAVESIIGVAKTGDFP